jgi:hypothetical protein
MGWGERREPFRNSNLNFNLNFNLELGLENVQKNSKWDKIGPRFNGNSLKVLNRPSVSRTMTLRKCNG